MKSIISILVFISAFTLINCPLPTPTGSNSTSSTTMVSTSTQTTQSTTTNESTTTIPAGYYGISGTVNQNPATPLANATVDVYNVNTDGSRGSQLNSFTSNSVGKFAITLPQDATVEFSFLYPGYFHMHYYMVIGMSTSGLSLAALPNADITTTSGGALGIASAAIDGMSFNYFTPASTVTIPGVFAGVNLINGTVTGAATPFIYVFEDGIGDRSTIKDASISVGNYIVTANGMGFPFSIFGNATAVDSPKQMSIVWYLFP